MNSNDAHLVAPVGHNYVVAVIDADRIINHELSTQLRHTGCTVLQAYESEEIAGIFDQDLDFIIIDPISESCHDFSMCNYISTTTKTGVIVFTRNPQHEKRDSLFECGILECFYKDEPLSEVVNEMLQLFKTVKSNNDFRLCIITDAEITREKLKKLIFHRNYTSCFLDNCNEIKKKWEYNAHDYPDLLILDLKKSEHVKEAFEFIHYIRIQKLLEIPIIAMLDSDERNLSPKLYRAGVNDVLIAPYSHEKLLSMITHHLDYRISKKQLKYEQSLSNQLKAMIDSSSIVSKANTSGIITYVNEEFCHISGYTVQELLGQPHNIIRHPDNAPELFEQMWNMLQSKKTFHGIVMNRRKDGTTYYVDSSIAPILDDNDTIIEYISIRYDVTPLIEKQHEIEDQRRQIQNVLDAQTSLICMVDKITGIRQANSNFMEFLGISTINDDECQCKYLNELFLDAADAFTVKHGERYVWLDRLYEMRKKFITVVMKDHFNNHHVFSIHVAMIHDTHFSNNTCYLVTLDNVTELTRALRETKAASAAESRFLATMSHEIRTPLNGILGFSELLSETPLNAQQLNYLKAIESSGETLRQIINNILDVMKMDQEHLELISQPTNIIGELEAMIYPFYSQAAKKEVDLLVYLDPKLPLTVEIDPLRLKQVLINLISNAIKFTPSHKRIYVRVKHLKTAEEKISIGITVADEGIGVKEEQKANIFKPFVQADNSISREYGGTGLGLNIVLRVIAAMGGHLSFKSTYTKGSVFHTTLEFPTDSSAYTYQCQHSTTYLYVPVSTPSPRLQLVEKYLKRFQCCESKLCRINTLESLSDTSNVNIILFMDMISLTEIQALIKPFKKVIFFIIPTLQSTAPFMPLISKNIIWIFNELSWSTLAKSLGIYNDHKLPIPVKKDHVIFKDLKILVAEDNEVNQFYIQELLTKLGIEFDLAHDGYEVVKKYINNHYDMVLMDINMPNMDGITATQQILRYEKEIGSEHTPIVGLSADAVATNITQYLKKGLNAYLIKPLQRAQLVDVLQEYFPSHIFQGAPSRIKERLIMHPTKSDEKELTRTVASQLELPEEIITALFKKFINNSNLILSQIQENTDDVSQLKMAIHSLKGISKNLYLSALGDLCENFEKEMVSLSAEQKLERLVQIRTQTAAMIKRMQEEIA
ncbi:MAG: response regulator [Sulfuricurvum sp.]|jgi:PAS domain S-box-containing protein